MRLRRIVGAAVLAAALSACAGPITTVPEARIETAPPSVSPTASGTDAAAPIGEPTVSEVPHRETADPVSCAGAGDVAVSFSPVDAGLGNRWLVLTVRNCSEEAITLPAEPIFEGISDDGSVFPASWRWDEPQGSLVLAPGSDKFVVAHWLSNGTCERGVHEFRFHLLGETFSEQDCFQFGGDMAPEREGDDGDLYWADDPGQPPGWQPS